MPKDDAGWQRILMASINVGVGAVLGAAVGVWIDSTRGTSPWGMAIGTMLGFAAGMYMLIREALRTSGSKRKDEDERK